MKCPACGFENLRGTERCISCRARLILPDRPAPETLAPPRASWHGRLLPQFRFAWNRFCETATGRVVDRLVRAARWMFWVDEPWPFKKMVAAFLSLVPGLGHLLLGRFLAALLALFIWLGLLGMTAFLWSGNASGTLLVSLVLGWHVQVMMDASGGSRMQGVKNRLLMVALLFSACLAVYGMAYRRLQERFEMIVLPFEMSSIHVEPGDGVLMRKDIDRVAFQKGMLVFFGNVPAMVLAIPGDRITLDQELFKINGQPMLPEMLPRRAPLATGPLPGEGRVEQGNIFSTKRLVVGSDQIVISIPVTALFQGSRKERNQMRIISRRSISSCAIAIWTPIGHRHWFRAEDFPAFAARTPGESTGAATQ